MKKYMFIVLGAFIATVMFLGYLVYVHQDDPEQAGAAYCDCMKKNNGATEYFYAFTVCNGEFVKKYKYFRIYWVDLKYPSLRKNINLETERKAVDFVVKMEYYMRDNCCEVTNHCRPNKRKAPNNNN